MDYIYISGGVVRSNRPFGTFPGWGNGDQVATIEEGSCAVSASQRAMITALCLVLWGALFSPCSGAQDKSPCDPFLRAAVDHPFAYRQLADRCEGIFVQEVSSSVLSIASLSPPGPAYDLESDQPLYLSWPSPVADDVQLRVNALRRRLYFRMDTRQEGNASPYVWPHNQLVALQIQRADLGLLAWVRQTVDGTELPVYLPLSLAQGAAAPPAVTYDLLVQPGVELETLYTGLAQMSELGKPMLTVREMEKFPDSFYPANHVIRIPIANLPETGLYRLQLSAIIRGGGSATLDVWFLHSGN